MSKISNKLLISKSEEIGNQLINDSTLARDGSLTWNRGANKFRQPVLDSGIFNGRCGEALFFAALYSITSKDKYHHTSLRIFKTLIQNYKDDSYIDSLINELWIGINGIGGLIYSLVKTGKLLKEIKLIQIAIHISSKITPELLHNDEKYDVIWGTAGALLGIVSVANEGYRDVLRNAEYCADYLLKKK